MASEEVWRSFLKLGVESHLTANRRENLCGWVNFVHLCVLCGKYRAGASNRYFGKYFAGDLKARYGSPPWIIQVEQEILTELANEPETAQLKGHVLAALAITHRYVSGLYTEKIPPVLWRAAFGSPENRGHIRASPILPKPPGN